MQTETEPMDKVKEANKQTIKNMVDDTVNYSRGTVTAMGGTIPKNSGLDDSEYTLGNLAPWSGNTNRRKQPTVINHRL